MGKKGKISLEGYRKNSPDRFNDFNIIPSQYIDMHNVNHDVLMIPMGGRGTGNPVLAKPGEQYFFPNHDFVFEQAMPENAMMRYQRIAKFGGLPMAQDGRIQATPTYLSGKEQNTPESMPVNRRNYEQALANQIAEQQLADAKLAMNVAGLVFYPAAAAASAIDFYEGNYGQGLAGLVPFVGPASKANTARNILNQASRNLLTKSYNAGIPYKIAAPIIKGAKKSTMYGANAANVEDAYNAFNDYAYKEGGSNPPGTSNVPVVSKKQAYQNAVKNNYQKYLESVNNITPYTESTKDQMNCIHGVCLVLKGTGAKNFMQEYTGNQTFKDAREKEGYYQVDPNNEGFEVGDIIQYSKTKEHMAEAEDNRYKGKVNPVNAKELVPAHAKVILDKYVDKDGITKYKIGHNSGTDNFTVSDIDETTLLQHANKGLERHGTKFYEGLIVNRYDPEYVEKKRKEDTEELKKIKGENPYTSMYKTPAIKELHHAHPEAHKLLDYYKKNYQKIGKTADMPPAVLDKLFHNQVGIFGQETNFGEEGFLKELVPDALLPTARHIQDTFRTSDDWITDYWNNNADDVKSKYMTKEQFANEIKARNKLSSEAREYLRYEGPRSKGIFQQKDLSKRGRVLGSDFDNAENQFLSSMYLAIDNYHLLKKKYPDMSNDELVDLTTLMHNAPSKALTPEYVNYYLKNNNIDYVNKVKNLRGDLVVEKKPSYVQKLKQDTAKKVKPEEIEAIKKFLLNQAGSISNKKVGGWLNQYATGGWLDHYEPGGEKPWGEMTPQERAAYLNAKEKKKPMSKAQADAWAKQAEEQSRKKGKQEYYEDYVREGTEKALTHPLLNFPTSFMPEGMAIGMLQSAANYPMHLANDQYGMAALDLLGAIPFSGRLAQSVTEAGKKVIPVATKQVQKLFKTPKFIQSLDELNKIQSGNKFKSLDQGQAYFQRMGNSGLESALAKRNLNVGTVNDYYNALNSDVEKTKFLNHLYDVLEGSKIDKAVSSIDQTLGNIAVSALGQKSKAPELKTIVDEANKKLTKGLGIKKGDMPISLEIAKHDPSQINVKIGDTNTGYLNLAPVGTKDIRLSQLLKGDKPSMAKNYFEYENFVNATQPGYAKAYDFPFTYTDVSNHPYYGKNLKGQGYSAELNEAINRSLKERGARLYSGSTGHTEEGAARYANLLQKGLVENISPRIPGSYNLKYPENPLYMYKRYGGDPSLPAITGHYKKGGRLPGKHETNKNIKSSINYLMRRNETLFGPAGKNFYNPNPMSKYYKGGIAFPQQPTAGDTKGQQESEFYSPNWIPPGPVGFYEHGGIAYPQLPTEDYFFSGSPWMPHYNMGGLPGGANNMPCYECGGYMEDGGMYYAQNGVTMPSNVTFAQPKTSAQYDIMKNKLRYTDQEMQGVGVKNPALSPEFIQKQKELRGTYTPAAGGGYRRIGEDSNKVYDYISGKYTPRTAPITSIPVAGATPIKEYGGLPMAQPGMNFTPMSTSDSLAVTKYMNSPGFQAQYGNYNLDLKRGKKYDTLTKTHKKSGTESEVTGWEKDPVKKAALNEYLIQQQMQSGQPVTGTPYFANTYNQVQGYKPLAKNMYGGYEQKGGFMNPDNMMNYPIFSQGGDPYEYEDGGNVLGLDQDQIVRTLSNNFLSGVEGNLQNNIAREAGEQFLQNPYGVPQAQDGYNMNFFNDYNKQNLANINAMQDQLENLQGAQNQAFINLGTFASNIPNWNKYTKYTAKKKGSGTLPGTADFTGNQNVESTMNQSAQSGMAKYGTAYIPAAQNGRTMKGFEIPAESNLLSKGTPINFPSTRTQQAAANPDEWMSAEAQAKKKAFYDAAAAYDQKWAQQQSQGRFAPGYQTIYDMFGNDDYRVGRMSRGMRNMLPYLMFNPQNTYLQETEPVTNWLGRNVGTRMKFRTVFDPRTGQQIQVPVNNTSNVSSKKVTSSSSDLEKATAAQQQKQNYPSPFGVLGYPLSPDAYNVPENPAYAYGTPPAGTTFADNMAYSPAQSGYPTMPGYNFNAQLGPAVSQGSVFPQNPMVGPRATQGIDPQEGMFMGMPKGYVPKGLNLMGELQPKANGGKYKEGGIHELTEDEIQQIMAAGGSITYLD